MPASTAPTGETARVDAYIRKAEMAYQPTMIWVRRTIHETCPDVRETIKWGMPHFEYHGILAWMGAFKSHIGVGLWHGSGKKAGARAKSAAMGNFGRVTKIGDLPPKPELVRMIRKSMRLNAVSGKAKK